ncbi:hypothetical protein ACP4OV_028819 [Aristida adscensionis]
MTGGCAAVGNDIASCQSRGVKVLLSIGGGMGNYSLASATDAQALASYLWVYFLGGAAVLDGIDFAIKDGSSGHYDDLVKNLASQYDTEDARRRTYVLAAAPRWEYPDAALGAALATGLFDQVWVQFYNDPTCEYWPGDVAKLRSVWEQWARSLPSRTALLLGLPASSDFVASGYIAPHHLASEVLPVLGRANNHSGIMLWSRYQDMYTGYSTIVTRDVASTSIADPPTAAPPTSSPTGPSQKRRIKIYIVAGSSALVGIGVILLVFFLWYKTHYGMLPWQRGVKDYIKD